MKKGNFSHFVQEGRLIEFQFEPEPMQAVLNEILKLLSSVDSRLDEIESKIPLMAYKKQADEIQNENSKIIDQLERTNKNTEEKLKEYDENIDKKLEDTRHFVDDSVSAVLVDVRRFMKTQLDESIIMNSNRDNETSTNVKVVHKKSDNSDDDIFKVCSNMQSSIDSIFQDIKQIRTGLEEKVTPEILQKELEPVLKYSERIGDCDADILTLQLSLQNLQDRVQNIETVQKIPGAPIEVHVRSSGEVSTVLPTEPQNQVIDHEHQMQHKEQETKMKHMEQQLHKIQTNITQPPTDDSASIERQVRRLNEFANSFRLALDNHDRTLAEFRETLEHAVSQSNMKRLQALQNVDQLTSELERLKEQISGMTSTRDLSKSFEELNYKFNNIQKEINSQNERKNKIVKPDFRYNDRYLPPLQTQNLNEIEFENADFGLHDSSDEYIYINQKENSRPNSSFNTARKAPLDMPDEFPSPPLTACSTDRKKMSSKRKDNVIKILRQPITRQESSPVTVSPIVNVPSLSEEEIREKVDHAVRLSISNFLEKAKAEAQKEVKNGLKVVDQVSSKIDQKIDRDFVERMFNKFRIIISELKEKIDQIQSTFLSWVTREELQEVLEKFVEQLQDVKDTAVGSSKYKCLLCGRPRTHVSGMIVGDSLMNCVDEDDENLSNYGDERSGRVRKKAATKVPSPVTPKRPKRCKTPVPRDVVQFLTSAEVTRK